MPASPTQSAGLAWWLRRLAGKRKDAGSVSRFGLVVRRSAGKRKDAGSVSRLGPVTKRLAGKRKDAGSTPRFGSPFSSKIVILWTLSRGFALAQLMKH